MALRLVEQLAEPNLQRAETLPKLAELLQQNERVLR